MYRELSYLEGAEYAAFFYSIIGRYPKWAPSGNHNAAGDRLWCSYRIGDHT